MKRLKMFSTKNDKKYQIIKSSSEEIFFFKSFNLILSKFVLYLRRH